MIHLHIHDRRFRLNNRKLLKRFIKSLFEEEQKELKSLQYIFCSDNYLLAINQQYLKHNTLTDIITFNLSDEAIEGEIYISIDRVKENARKYSVSMEDEIYRVMFHGALHLCGYRDKTQRQQHEMRRKENKYLFQYWQLNGH